MIPTNDDALEKKLIARYWRRCQDSQGKRIDNAKLPAGSPMHYYCRHCGTHTETLSEIHTKIPVTLCLACEELARRGLMPVPKPQLKPRK